MGRFSENHADGRAFRLRVVLLFFVGLIALAGSQDAMSANSGRWYQVVLETGEINGYQWAVGAKGLKHEPLDEICVRVSLLEPITPDAPFVEGSDSVGCSSLMKPTDSVAESASFGAKDSRMVIFAVLYRPTVRKVIFFLGGGKRMVFRPRIAKVPNGEAQGIPKFRYLITPFKSKTCIRKVTLFDGSGKAISLKSAHARMKVSCKPI